MCCEPACPSPVPQDQRQCVLRIGGLGCDQRISGSGLLEVLGKLRGPCTYRARESTGGTRDTGYDWYLSYRAVPATLPVSLSLAPVSPPPPPRSPVCGHPQGTFVAQGYLEKTKLDHATDDGKPWSRPCLV